MVLNIPLPPEIRKRENNERQKINYQNLLYLCSTGIRQPQSKSENTYTKSDCPYWLQFKAFTNLDLSEFEGKATHYAVKPTVRNVDIATRKYDLPKFIPTTATYMEMFVQAVRYFVYISGGISSSFEINSAAGAGPVARQRGFKTKGDLFTIVDDKMIPKQILADSIFKTDTVPMFGSFTKMETLPFDDVKPISVGGREKIRLVQGPDCHFYIGSMILYNEQNKKMLAAHMTHWIKYGVSKEYGGFHQMVKPLEALTALEISDCSGFDKTVDLTDVYRIRNDPTILKLHKDLHDFRDYVTDFIVHPVIILPNGDIVRATLNPSGSSNTTPDNSIAHFLVLMYLIFKCLKRAFPDVTPTFQLAFKYANYCIYSDDKLGGLMHKQLKITKEEYIALSIETYAEFGMKLKPNSIYFQEKEVGELLSPELSFLGSSCTYDKDLGMYYPTPRLDKITSSFCYKPINGGLSKIDFLVRAYQLAVHLAPLPYYGTVAMNFLNFLQDHDDFLECRVAYDHYTRGGGELKETPHDTYLCTVMGLEGKLA